MKDYSQSAFPGSGYNQGMSLRDYFAAKAMPAAIAALNGHSSLNVSLEQAEVVAAFSYRMADAMLAERAE